MSDWSGEYNMTTVHAYCADRKAYLRDSFRDVHAYPSDCEPDTYGPLDDPNDSCRGGADVCAEDELCLEYAAKAATAWCDHCWHQQTDTVDSTVAWEDVTNVNASCESTAFKYYKRQQLINVSNCVNCVGSFVCLLTAIRVNNVSDAYHGRARLSSVHNDCRNRRCW
jgi:hypothetical protein